MPYFSERENGPLPRDDEEICDEGWGGIRALIEAGVEDGAFGVAYPENCDDGPIPIGTNHVAFRDAMRAHIPGLATWPWRNTSDVPSTPDILDMIEFCWKSVGKPSRIVPHPKLFYHHNHLLEFDVEAGREEFRTGILTVFRRNRLAYELTPEGHIERLTDPVLREAFTNQDFDTGDSDLDDLLNKAKLKFLDPNPETRREALEHLWDAWEKLRSLGGQGSVSQRAAAMLDAAAGQASPKFREALGKEAHEIYSLGNNHDIRHRNMNQERLARNEHVDYLFHRMFSLIQMILRLR